MKLIYKYLIMIFILILGCDGNIESIQNSLSVAIDQTEGNSYRLSSDFILNELKTIGLQDGIELSLIAISDTRYTIKQRFLLEQGETGWLANEDLRRKQRKLLFKRFKDSLVAFNSNTKILDRSEVFRVVVTELNRLALNTGNRKLIISSDLKEHSSIFSVYNPNGLRLLLNKPKEVVSIFESSVSLMSDLSGITIQLIHKPSLQEAELYSKLVSLYTIILESRGATVVVGYHNTITI